MIDVLRAFAGLSWLAAFVFLTGSFLRGIAGPSRPFDKVWGLFWFLAAHQLGYAIRWISGLSAPPDSHASLMTLAGLHVLSAGIALGIIYQRGSIEGWRW